MSNAVARAAKKKANPLPILYEEAKTAIAKSASVDECKDWADKAAALRVYAKQSKDKALEHNAIRIRARAVRREGTILDEIEADRVANKKGSKGGRAPSNHSRKKAGRDAGLSDHEIKTAMRLNNIPDDQFERQIESDEPPTIEALAKQGVQPHPKATGLDKADMEIGRALWGLVKNAQRDAEKIDVDRALRGMTPKEIESSIERGEALATWLADTLSKMKRASK